MNQNRWKTVNEIFHAALEIPPGEREQFILGASQGDSELQSEVERMLAADEKAAGYLESHTLLDGFFGSISLIQPGDVLKERFHIRRQLGEGGMGQVFEAWDEDLQIPIAVKAIRPEISERPGMRSSFRREVRIARSITHPNVCRIYELDRAIVERDGDAQREMLFLTMEYLEGETLASRLSRRGPLPVLLALAYARQIASALDAAHAAGIVHRDIKPANVILVESIGGEPDSTRVVVTDFGLARGEPLLSGAQHSSTSLGVPAGTIAYMAPEQMEASTVVTGAIDIYAFGLVLFEMVTGRRAFPTTNLLTGITQRLSGPPPSARFINPDIPEKWEITIQTCLRRDPSERFSSAGAVIEALEGTRSSPLHSVPIRIPASSAEISVHSRPWRHKWAIAITGLVVIVSLFAVWLRLYRQKGESKVAPGALVYLTQIQNQTGIHAFDNLTELLKASLGQSTRINLLDQGRVGDTLQLMTKPPDSTIDAPTAREIAMRTGAVRIIFATLTGSAGSYKLDVDIQQPDNTPAHARNDWKESFVWKAASGQPGNAIPQEILHTIRDAADWIRAKAGESANDIARLDTPPEDVTTSNWEALQEYARAEAFVSARQQEKAVDVLENAVRIDPQFALAYGRLGDVLDSISRDADGYQAYSKALSVGFQARLTRRERDRIKGMMALDTEDEAAAEAAFRDYATYYEYDYAGWFYRAYPLMMLGRTGEAIETLKKAFSLDPERVSAPAHLARYALLEHNTEDAWRWQAWLQSHGFSEDASFVAGQIELTTAHYAAAEQSFTALLKSKDPYYQSLADSLLARFYAERGELPQAQSSLEAGMAIDNLHNFVALQQEKLIDQAYLQCADGKWAEAASDIRSALKLNPGLRDLISASATLGWCNTRSNAAHSDALVDILRAVQRRLPAQEDSLLSQDAAFRIAGELALAQGDWKLGVEEMEKANTVEPPSNSRAYLARAYETAAHLNADTAGLHHYLEMALAVDQTLASQDALAWNRMLVFPPGSYSETLESLLRVSRELKRPLSDPIREAQARLNALRLPASRQAGNRFLQHAVPPFTSTPFPGE